MTAPLASKRSNAFSTSEEGSPRRSPSCVAVAGPRCVIQPLTVARSASSRDGRLDSPHLHRARAAFLKGSTVQIGIRIRIQNLMGQLRARRYIDGYTTTTTFVHAAKNTLQTIDVHRLGEHVFHHVIDQMMVGSL